MKLDQQTYQRGISASLLGLSIQIVVATILLVVGLWLKSDVVLAATWHAFGGVGIWLVLAVIYQQFRLTRLEELEADELRRTHGAQSSIFETGAAEFSVAKRRLERLQRWGLPLISLLTGGYLIGVGIWQLTGNLALLGADALVQDTLDIDPLQKRIAGEAALESPGLVLAFLVGLWFLTFVVSRYIAGMGKQKEWSLLRGGSGYLMGNSIIAVVLAVGYALLFVPTSVVLKYLAVGIPGFMIGIGIEMLINLVLNVYRPRKLGVLPKPAFDSRLLSLLTTPESIAKSINEALNYQFGFEVSRSWFWRLFSGAFGYLVIMGGLVLMGLSSLVIVEPQQQAVVMKFGSISDQVLDPGLHFKAPWPFATVQRYDVTTVREIRIGGAEQGLKEGVPILWNNEHYEGKPMHHMVASPQTQSSGHDEARAPSISLVNSEVFIQYRIANLLDYLNSSDDADTLLRVMGERLLSQYLLHRDLDQWVGPARRKASLELRDRLQAVADEHQLGIEVVAMPVASIHPPQPVAEAFHLTVIAQQEKVSEIEKARRDAIKRLATAAGSVEKADAIAQAVADLENLTAAGASAEQVDQKAIDVEQLVLEAGGEAAQMLAEARADRWNKENTERGQVALYKSELQAFAQAKQYYKLRAYLNAVSESLKGARKFVLLADRDRLILRGNLTDMNAGFADLQFDKE